MKLRLSLLALVVFFSNVTAGVRVSHRLVNNSLEVFFLKDFDITSPASGPPIFFIDIVNDDLPGSQPRTIILRIQVQTRRHGTLSRGETGSFDIAPGQTLTLTNRNLFSNTDPHRLVTYEISEDVVDELLQDILSTGKLPTDTYTFDLQIVEIETQAPLDDDSFEVDISNPQKLDLVFPGRPATGREQDCEEIFTEFPQFRWEGEMSRYQFVLAEAIAGEDPESVLNSGKRFSRIIVIGNRGSSDLNLDDLASLDLIRGDADVEFRPSTSFQFTRGENVDLEIRPGRTYYWRVTGIVETSSGPVALESEIYCFRLARLDQMGARKEQFEFILRNILGPDYEKLFGEGGQLENYAPKRITLNGETVSFAELMRRINKLSANYEGYRIE